MRYLNIYLIKFKQSYRDNKKKKKTNVKNMGKTIAGISYFC